jgi:hypothetical protein
VAACVSTVLPKVTLVAKVSVFVTYSLPFRYRDPASLISFTHRHSQKPSSGCCKQSFRIYSPDLENTNGDAPYLGMIMKKPKSIATELFTDADAFEVEFPKDATADQKGIIMGLGIFINSAFFEGEDQGTADFSMVGG